MERSILGLSIAASLLAFFSMTGDTCADFVLIEDFDDLLPGPIDDQGGWYAQNDTSIVTTDPADAGNLVLAVTTDSTHLHREALLADGTVRMLFFRFRLGGQQNFSVGMSGSTFPDQFGEFEPELGMSNSTTELRINDGGMYDILTVLEPDTWYNCWLLINNIDDDSQVYLHAREGEAAESADQLDSEGQTVFEFRSGSAGNLVTYFIKTGGGSGPSGPLFLDDIYLEDADGLNLSNPSGAPCPADFDADGDVDTADLLFLLAAWGTADGDVDGDDDTDTADLLALLGDWGECPEQPPAPRT
jgi:hypothetical protein